MIAGFTRFSRSRRWGYTLFMIAGVLRIPAQAHFRFYAPVCDLGMAWDNARISLVKVPHFVLFGIFFLLTAWQFDRPDRRAFSWSLVATLALGVLVELEEGATRTGNCRLADLLPDLGGGLLAMALLLAFMLLRNRASRQMPPA
jgi:hypothetical protein